MQKKYINECSFSHHKSSLFIALKRQCFRCSAMSNSSKNTTCVVSQLTLISALKKTALPMDIILHLSTYLNLVDYRSFVKSIWPNDDEDDIVKEKLWRMSTHQFTDAFMNGKPLTIEYNYDASRIKKDRILFNMNYLLPVFGGVAPPAANLFTNLSKLYAFIEMHVNLDMCSGGQHASCRCREMNDGDSCVSPFEQRPEKCKRGHFHHYCSLHIRHWFDVCLATSVLLREAGYDDEDATKHLSRCLNNVIFVQRNDDLVSD